MSHPATTVHDMGRAQISAEPRVPTAVRLPESLHRRLHDAAAERDVSANRLITKAVEDLLDRLPPVEVALGQGGASSDNEAAR